MPREVRRIRLDQADRLDPESVQSIVTDAKSFAGRLAKIRRAPKLWRESNAVIAHRDDAEDAAEAADRLATDMEAFALDAATFDLIRHDSSGPFSADLEEMDKVLRDIISESDRVDPELVAALVDPIRHRSVHSLCGEIQECKQLRSLIASILHSPEDRNIDDNLQAARKFAEENSGEISPRVHDNKITKIDKEIGKSEALIEVARQLPDSWVRRSGRLLSEIQNDARILLSYPEAVRKIRYFDAECQVDDLAADLVKAIQQLCAEIAEIKRALPMADNHDSEWIRRLAETIRNSGFLRFLSGEFRNACETYCHVLGGAPRDKRATMVRHLEAYAASLDRRHLLESDIRFKTAFGSLFKGIATDAAAIATVADFHRDCREIAERASNLRVRFEGAGDWKNYSRESIGRTSELRRVLEAGDLTPIAALAIAASLPDMTLEELEDHVSTRSVERNRENARLIEARKHIALFKERIEVKIGELENIVAQKDREAELFGKIQSSPAVPILGSRFADIETDTDRLQVECMLAVKLAASSNTPFVIDILKNRTAPKFLDELNNFKARRRKIEQDAADLWKLLNLPENLQSTEALFKRVGDLRGAANDPDTLLDCAQFKHSEDRLRNHGFGALVAWAVKGNDKLTPDRLGSIVEAIIAKNMVDRVYHIHRETFFGYHGQDFTRIREEIAQRDRELIEISRRVIENELLGNANPPSGISFGRKSDYTDMGLIVHEMNKKQRHIGVRELTRRAGVALLELKPCWMMSPLAVAQYIHEGIMFDIVVIDEASQMTPENAIGALSRAERAVVVGDTKQLPPTSFFQKMLDESDTDEDLRDDSESVLDMANVAFMPIRQFRWHYRSRHPGLIQFSNKWLYKGRLTIFPTAWEDRPDLGVKLVELNGVYKSRRNEIEARAIVNAAIEHMATSPEQSLGICTMNSDQKDLIVEEFERVRDRDTIVQAYIARWEQDSDGLEEFFIKNLETIQGDERDVMFISTLYGPEIPGGRVLQRFGPINSIHGHRRLNVLFSRAKRKIVTFTSLNPADIQIDEKKNEGVRMFRAWLEYCKTGRIAETGVPYGDTESPFEDYVARQIEAMGCTAVPQVGVAGFRIDLGVRHPDWPYGYILGVECDGATYHSSKSSRDRDRLRQEVLESLGWKLHRIWSTDWFRNPRAEIETLKDVIEESLRIAKRNGAIWEQEAASKDVVSGEKLPDMEMVAETPELLRQEILSRPQQGVIPIEPSRDDLFFQTETSEPDESSADVFGMSVPSEPVVRVGSKVKVVNLSDGGSKLAFTLVKGENNPDEGLVSIHTPLGAALIDAQEGDEVEYQVGSYIKEVRVLEVRAP